MKSAVRILVPIAALLLGASHTAMAAPYVQCPAPLLTRRWRLAISTRVSGKPPPVRAEEPDRPASRLASPTSLPLPQPTRPTGHWPLRPVPEWQRSPDVWVAGPGRHA